MKPCNSTIDVQTTLSDTAFLRKVYSSDYIATRFLFQFVPKWYISRRIFSAGEPSIKILDDHGSKCFGLLNDRRMIERLRRRMSLSIA